MPCFHPNTVFQSLEGGPISWRELPDMRQLQIPCMQCVGCRLRRSANSATRCMHEAKMHPYNTWITLTYSDEHLPSRYHTGFEHPVTRKQIYSGSLNKEDPQKFFRRLRKALSREARRLNRDRDYQPLLAHAVMGLRPIPQPKLRYYYAGEYGEKYGRPHYHACIFGTEFTDKKLEKNTDQGFKLYKSKTLEKLWPHGDHLIGELTWQTAAYTARYIMKKINGKKQEKHYEKIDQETGEIISLLPEYNDMSRRPGIAATWLDKFLTDVYPHDRVIVRGHPTKPPRYYDKRYANKLRYNFNEDDLEGAYAELTKPLEQLKFQRQIESSLRWEANTPERLRAEEIITKRKIQSLKQKL